MSTRLWVDQYGGRHYAPTREVLRSKLPGRISIMYEDRRNGQTVRTGYVIGPLWLTEYRSVERDPETGKELPT